MTPKATYPKNAAGLPVFPDTEVPLRNLFEYLMRSSTIEDFLEDNPSISFEQVRQVLKLAEDALDQPAP